MKKYIDQGEDYRWNTDRAVNADDFNTINSVAIFIGPLLEMYPSVTREELKTLLERGEDIAVLDARDTEESEKAHIRGSVNIPVDLIERDARSVLKLSDHVITYSRDSECALSAVAADKLTTIGFEYVMRYTGGIEDWTKAGEPVEGKSAVKTEPLPEAA
jgi:rhodanese-related sulfurtransferase